MLILARHEHESVMIDGGIEIIVVEIDRGRVKLGFTAPKDTTILRKELCEQTEKELSIGKTVRTVPSGIYD